MSRVTGRKKGYIIALTLVQAVHGGLGVVYALFLRSIVDSAVGKDAVLFKRSVFQIIILVLIQLAIAAVIRFLRELAKSDIENAFKQRLTDHILRKDYASVSAVHTAEWLNRLTNDTTVVADGLADILPGFVGMVVRLGSALVMIIVMDRWFAGILLPGGVALLFLTYAFRRVLKRLHRNIQESDGRLRIFLQERISNLMVIRSFAVENQVSHQAGQKMAEHKAARMKRSHFSNLCNVGFGAAMRGMYLIGVVYCAHGILIGTVSYGTLTAIMQLIGQVQAPFANISGYLPRWYAMTASAERLMEVEAFADDGDVADLSVMQDFYQGGFYSLGLSHVSFGYGTDEPVLKDACLEIRRGEYIAFTGHSGCGKSTVLKLLMCMYPVRNGERYVRKVPENSGGKESGLRSESPELEKTPLTAHYRRLFAYVPQGNALMNGTIREVVSFADPGAAYDNERMQRALAIACADEFVDDPEMMLGERGSGLSEGQMQRIAIARAVFSGSPILLLDEATSALDESTENRLLENLRTLTDKTVIIVTHRKAAQSICDRVIRFSEEGLSD